LLPFLEVLLAGNRLLIEQLFLFTVKDTKRNNTYYFNSAFIKGKKKFSQVTEIDAPCKENPCTARWLLNGCLFHAMFEKRVSRRDAELIFIAIKGTQSRFCACARFWFLDRRSRIQRCGNGDIELQNSGSFQKGSENRERTEK